MTFLYYWRMAVRARFILLAVVVTAVAAALVVVTVRAKIYTAQASLLSPRETQQQQGMSMLGALLGGMGGSGGRDGGVFALPSLFGSVPSLTSNQDMFVAILKSKVLRHEVVAELRKKYGADVGSRVGDLDVNTREKGVILLSLEATDAALAAEGANLHVELLDRTLERFAQKTGRELETRYADQIQRAAREVSDAEAALLKFQTQHRVPPIESIVRSSNESVSSTTSGPSGEPALGLRGQIMSLEMQREVLRMRATDQHPQARELDKQIAELKKQYAKNLFGAPMDLPGERPGQQRKEFFVSADKLTPVQFEYLKLFRNLKIQEAFYTGALQGLEQLRYNEGVNRVRVEPLDPALPPVKPTRPNIPLTLAVAAVAGIVVTMVVLDRIQYFRRLRAEELEARGSLLDRLGPLPPPDDALMPSEPFSVTGRGRQ